MVGRERGVGRSNRQLDLPPGEVRDIGAILVALDYAADISDVMGEAGQNEVRIVGGRGGPLQRPSHQDVVPDQRHQHGVFDIVIECIAVPDALQCQPGGKRQQFRQIGMRGAESAFGFPRQETSQGLAQSVEEL